LVTLAIKDNKRTAVKQVKNNNLEKGQPHRWKPGESGNPNGRPPAIKYVSESLRELLQKDAGNGKIGADIVAQVIYDGVTDKVENMLRGINTPLVKELLDRTEGKVPGDQPLAPNVNVVFIIGKGYKDIPQLEEGDELLDAKEG